MESQSHCVLLRCLLISNCHWNELSCFFAPIFFFFFFRPLKVSSICFTCLFLFGVMDGWWSDQERPTHIVPFYLFHFFTVCYSLTSYCIFFFWDIRDQGKIASTYVSWSGPKMKEIRIEMWCKFFCEGLRCLVRDHDRKKTKQNYLHSRKKVVEQSLKFKSGRDYQIT